MSSTKKTLACVVLAEFLIPGSAPSFAQDKNVEEIIITAQKREENIQDVPISISAMTNTELETKGVFSFKDVSLAVPSISSAPAYGAPGTLMFYMRGVGTSDPDSVSSEGGVGIYEDGFFVARSDNLTFDMGELERVEVLRGPQGTLYGFNTAGGAVNLISKRPTGQFGFKQSLDFGNRDMYRSSSVINFPEWNKVSTKLIVFKSGVDGFVKNVGSSHDYGENRQTGAKLLAHWEPNDTINADYFVEYGTQKASPQQYFQNKIFNGRYVTVYNEITLSASGTYLYSDANKPQHRTYRPIDLPLKTSKVSSHGLTLSWDLNDSLTIKSLTGYRHSQSKRANNFAESFDVDSLQLGDDERGGRNSHQLSEELQFIGDALESKLNYVAGFYFFKERGWQEEDAVFPVYELVPLYGSYAFSYRHEQFFVRSRSIAMYGQASWDTEISNHDVTFTVGARQTRDRREGKELNLLDGSRTDRRVVNFSKFTPAGSVDIKWNDELSTYIKVATGYRAGGLCLRGNNQCFTPKYDPEKLVSYELGVKSYWLDRKIRLNIAIFNNEYKDIQLGFTNGIITDNAVQGTFNAGKSSIKGLELDALWSATDELKISINYSYLNAKIKEIQVPPGSTFDSAVNPDSPYAVTSNAKGAFVMPFTPRHSLSLAFDSVVKKWGENELTMHLDYSYQSSNFHLSVYGHDAPGYDKARVPSHGLFNGRVTLSTLLSHAGRLNVSLWGKNLSNKKYIITKLGQGNNLTGFTSSADAWAQPRTYGVSLTYEVD